MASSKRDDADWREFEMLVARIEADAGPSGMIVKCPDKIRSNVTGRLREVDASIRYKVGTTEVLATFADFTFLIDGFNLLTVPYVAKVTLLTGIGEKWLSSLFEPVPMIQTRQPSRFISSRRGRLGKNE